MTDQEFAEFLKQFNGVKRSGDGYVALCPSHNDQNPSLSITLTDKGKLLMHCHADCTFKEVMACLSYGQPERKRRGRIAATYSYCDEKGKLLYQAVRYEPKDFRFRRPDGNGGWTYKITGTRRVLYRLRKVIKGVKAGATIFVVEGEKDVKSLEKLGLTATTNPGGAGKGKWLPEFSDVLKGAQVIIIPDNDEAGRLHADEVARALHGKAREIVIFDKLPVPEKGDVTDWIDAGGSATELINLIEQCDPWEPPPEEKPKTVADLAQILPSLSWPWPGWLARGYVCLLAGESGVGKSMVALYIVKCFTTGARWPDGSRPKGKPMKGLWCEAEAAQAMLLHRVEKMGLPSDSILLPLNDPTQEVSLNNSEHRHAIEKIAEREDVSVIVVDSLRGAYQGDENSSEIMSTMAWLAALARDTQKVIIVIHHLRKTKEKEKKTIELSKVRGSSAIVQPARIVMGLDKPDENKETLRLSMLKINIGVKPPPIGVEILEDGVNFCDAPEPIEDPRKLFAAQEFLKSFLGDKVLPAKRVKGRATNLGIASKTLLRAKRDLRIKSWKVKGKWYWHFPHAKKVIRVGDNSGHHGSLGDLEEVKVVDKNANMAKKVKNITPPA